MTASRRTRYGASPRATTLVAVALVLIVGAPFAVGAQEASDPALTALRSGRYEEAINAWRQRLRAGAGDAETHRRLAAALLEVGRFEQAEEVARNYIADTPDSVELYRMLGEVLRHTGRLDEAEAAFQRAIDGGAADRLSAEISLAVAAFDRGRRDEAMARFDRFIDYYNSGVATTSAELTAVGIACQYLGIGNSVMFQDALKAFDEAAAADPGNLTPKVLTAELFLAKYDSGGAATELSTVLQLNPQHPGALVATARRMIFDGESGAAAMIESALQTNPRLVDAMVLRARTMLTAERFDDAIEEMESALEINPASLEALAVLATAHYLNDDRAAFSAARSRVLEINPEYAELYNTLSDLLVQNRLYAEAVEFAREATTVDPQSWRGYSILGVNQLRVGDIEGGRASLETAFAGDPYNVWVKNTLDLLDTFDEYVESSTARFDLMIEDGPEAELLSLYIGMLAEEAYDYFAERYRYSPPTPIRIEVYPSHADFSVRTVGLAGLGALGVSFGPVIAIDSPSARPLGQFNWGTTLWHEIAHTFTLGATDFKIPRWFSEGLSVYEERRARDSWGDDVSPSFLMAHQREMLPPVSRITEGFVRPQYPEQVIHSYYQASLVCELIDRDWGFDAILGMLDAYKRGLSTDDAFEEILGIDAQTFDRRFNEYVEQTFATPLQALAATDEETTAVGGDATPEYLRQRAQANPGSFAAQLSYGIALFEAQQFEEAERHLNAAKRLFPGYADAGSPYRYLAEIALERGDTRGAVEELETLTGINEKLYEANAELAALYRELGEIEMAAATLERLVYIYPLEIDMHLELAELYSELEVHDRAIRERRAVVALQPVDMAEAWYRLARAQLAGGEQRAARSSVLRSLEIAPSYPAAQELLLQIAGRGSR